MNKINIQEFDKLIKKSNHIKPKLKRDLRFNNSIVNLTDEEWDNSEIIPIFDKTNNHGVLIIDFDNKTGAYLLPFDLSIGLKDATGKTRPIICDFCRTWRSGSEAGSITFTKDKKSLHTVTFLCCGDLKCSMNSRNMTKAALRSKTQIREDILVDGKILRLQDKIREIIKDLENYIIQ